MNPPRFIYHLRTSPFHEIIMLHTSRPLFSYNSRPLFFPPTTSNGSPCARIATWAYTGGNDLPWQGQRKPSQCLRQWNNQCQNQGADMILYFLKRLSFPFPFLPFFLSSLDIYNTWFLAFENWVWELGK